MMRLAMQHDRESTAPHADYYSTTKKKRILRAASAASDASSSDHRACSLARSLERRCARWAAPRNTPLFAKMRMEQGLLATHASASPHVRGIHSRRFCSLGRTVSATSTVLTKLLKKNRPNAAHNAEIDFTRANRCG